MTAEIMNWTGHLLKGKREKLGEIRNRAEARRTGVYLLLGEDVDGGPLAYIGQSDDVAGRLVQHDAKKEFWNEVVVVTSKDTNLTSAHVRYLESRLIRLAKSVGRVPLTNGNEPSGGADLPEADASDMDYFIDQVRILLPVLGVEILRGREQRGVGMTPVTPILVPAEPSAVESSPIFRLTNRAGVNASAQVIDGEFTLLAGSVIRAAMRDPSTGSESTLRHYASRGAIHANLVADAAIGPNAQTVVTVRDHAFNSPSAAAAVVQGHGTANGRTAWATEDGTTFGAWESRGVEDQAGQPDGSNEEESNTNV
ncbi:GIY-YIG nuclease family protein [Cellulosimicrobium composti]|nr:GIY-YIG nuclease family protein [Cellulosimicrobium composti]